MIELKSISVKITDFEELENEIRAVMKAFYLNVIPLDRVTASNSNNYLEDAINHGKIYYDNEGFRGTFNSKISRELSKLGGKWDGKNKSWKIPFNQLPSNIMSAIFQNKARNTIRTEDLLKNIQVRELEIPVNGTIEKMAKKFESDVNKTIPIVTLQLSEKERMAIVERYSENLKLDIKKWQDEEILTLRQEVIDSVKKGIRYESIVEDIVSRYSVSISKAKFLARQETHLLLAEIKEQKYRSVGVNKYRWHTRSLPIGFEKGNVRPQHAELDNQVFTWDNPPIVDTRSGKRAHPGQDYNCRCMAIPLWEGIDD